MIENFPHIPYPLQKTLFWYASNIIKLQDPDIACGRCEYISKDFLTYYPDGKLLYLYGSKKPFPNRCSFYKKFPETDKTLYHVVIETEDICIDFTRRQFDPDCCFPHIQTRESLDQDWIIIKNSPNDLPFDYNKVIPFREKTKFQDFLSIISKTHKHFETDLLFAPEKFDSQKISEHKKISQKN